MTEFTDRLNRAADAATCGVLTSGGSALIGAGAWGLGAGGSGLGAIGAGAAALMAANYLNCGGWDPNGPGAPPSGSPTQLCYKGESNFTIRVLTNGVFIGGSTPEIAEITNTAFDRTESCQTGGSRSFYKISWIDTGGAAGSTTLQYGGPCGGDVYTWTQVWEGASGCEKPGPAPGPIEIPPFSYTDGDSGCSLTVNFEGFATTPGGGANPVFKIEPGAQVLAGDTVIGGCNFEPVIYMGDPNGGPPFVGPWEPEWDDPDADPFPWGPVLDEIAEGIAGAATKKDLDEKFDTPLPETEYRLNSVCEVDAAGNPIQEQVIVPVPSVAPFEALMARIDALIPLLQGQKDFKQPTCSNVKLAGEFRTIGFISEDYSPNGRNHLRKRLRYRSQSGLGLDALIDHWKDFRFDAGPVIVKHRGASWGTVTVWASSSGEGKRVIRHAAGEAGIDADQVGRWEISGSSSTRLGMSGKMKVNTSGGYFWITARDGSSARPLVGTT